jgi:hypothetical protein
MPAPKDQGIPVNVTLSTTIQYTSATPAPAGSMVDFNGALPATGNTPVLGVLREDAVQNRYVSVALAGLVEIISGSAITAGDRVNSGTDGRALSSGAGAQAVGRIMPGYSATAAGQRIQMLITREGTN